MVEVAEALVEQEAALLEEGASVQESLVTRVSVKDLGDSVFWLLQENMSSSVMVRVHNFLKVPLQAVRTSTAAGEVGDAVHDVAAMMYSEHFNCVNNSKVNRNGLNSQRIQRQGSLILNIDGVPLPFLLSIKILKSRTHKDFQVEVSIGF